MNNSKAVCLRCWPLPVHRHNKNVFIICIINSASNLDLSLACKTSPAQCNTKESRRGVELISDKFSSDSTNVQRWGAPSGALKFSPIKHKQLNHWRVQPYAYAQWRPQADWLWTSLGHQIPAMVGHQPPGQTWLFYWRKMAAECG